MQRRWVARFRHALPKFASTCELQTKDQPRLTILDPPRQAGGLSRSNTYARRAAERPRVQVEPRNRHYAELSAPRFNHGPNLPNQPAGREVRIGDLKAMLDDMRTRRDNMREERDALAAPDGNHTVADYGPTGGAAAWT